MISISQIIGLNNDQPRIKLLTALYLQNTGKILKSFLQERALPNGVYAIQVNNAVIKPRVLKAWRAQAMQYPHGLWLAVDK